MAGTLQTQLVIVVFICAYLYSITGTRKVLFFFYFPHVQLSTIDPGVFFEQSKSTCHNDALQQILHWFLRRKYSTLGSESNR
jgi:hypothetical protein